jgi:hypothetical protein
MSGIAFFLLLWITACVVLLVPNYIFSALIERIFIYFSTIKPATIASFERKRFSIYPIFQSTIEFSNDEKKEKSP